jgi:hypothetical protein
MQNTKMDSKNNVILKEDENFDKEEFKTLIKTKSLGVLRIKT